MKEITAMLVRSTDNQRYYELSEPIIMGIAFKKEFDIRKEIEDVRDNEIKDIYKKEVLIDGCHVICISDAHTHIERLAFVAQLFSFGYGMLGIQIDGKHTFMTDGGNINSVYPDEVYLRHLGIINGVKIKLL